MNAANQISTTLKEMMTHQTDGINKTLAAIDTVSTAISTASDKAVEIGNKLHAAIDEQNVRARAGQAAMATEVSGGYAKAGTKGTEAASSMASLIPAMASVDDTHSGTSSGLSFQLMKSPTVATTVDLNPFNDADLSPVITWLRAIIALAIAGGLTWWTYTELQQYLFFGTILQPARGNTVAGSGGQITSGIVAAWVTLALLSLPTAFFALAEGAPLLSTFGGGVVHMFNDAPAGAAQIGVYFIYGFLPMPTIISALSTMLIVRKGGMSVFFGVAT